MTARIAFVGDGATGPVPPSSPDVEVRVLDPQSLQVEHVLGADGLWAAAGGPAVERAADTLRSAGVPVGGVVAGAPPWPGPGLDPRFVDAARSRAVWREQAEAAARTRTEERAALETAEAEPRPYVHQMRGPRHRWWRPVLWLLLVVVLYVLVNTWLGVVVLLAGVDPATLLESVDSPSSLLVLNGLLIVLIPVTLVASGVAHWRSPWRVLSVAGRLRWGWLARCLLLVTPLWALYLAGSWVVFDQEVLPRTSDWVWLVVVALLTTPLQSAAEELFFRGGLVQAVGSWFRRPVLALVVTTVVSTAAFAAAHGSADPWILTELASLGVLGCYLAWRTGGLEAAIALHVVNNVLITVSGAVLGGLGDSYIDTTTTGSPLSALMSWVVTVVAVVVILWHGRRKGVVPRGWLTPARG
ncbi:CPBP family intramembrane metalloprotease [Phycicoccus sp. CSK15P-2]|uniref:CPBP family intramembrane glutamic endopeptidase n=1 Tax=Phycicoccus sp. CSK15P-2 TaxID=2807627 RepID=UPI00195064EB|nr:CPBP family intramembrane glutamic endopeptidase [Phycicoccus sp. CSK15P-2]MBM6405712.1 CPBP family intramembrane metalloprotease [Phycicoccus sp. CSK15P-2]